MGIQTFLSGLFTPQHLEGSETGDLIIGSFFGDKINANGGDDLVFGLFGDDTINGGNGEDYLFGGFGHDVIAGNKGNDQMFGGFGDDMLVWNNGDGSDLMVGGAGYDKVQVNFNTDLVNDDLQNKDVAEFSVTDEGVQFARIELNDQAVNGLFQLDIRETEKLETNFGGGDDAAVIVDNVLDEIKLVLNGGDGVDLLDLSQADGPVAVDLKAGTAGSAQVTDFENVIGTEQDDVIKGDHEDNVISGLGGTDSIFGRKGNDTLVANKGDDFISGGAGDDLLVWNNGDGSDRMFGGKGYDTVQVNFNTDLVNDDLQNKDVAEFSTTDDGVQFARIELNDQAVNGLFQLDIQQTEKLETNFGGGDDAAVIVDDVLDQIALDLDGGDGVDTLDLSQADPGVNVDLANGTVGGSTAVNFENVIGTTGNEFIFGNDQDNLIRGGGGIDVAVGGAGADTFLFVEGENSIMLILDFEVGVDRIAFQTTDPDVTAEGLGRCPRSEWRRCRARGERQ